MTHLDNADEEFTIFICYVDDGIIISNKPEVISDMLEHLGKEFEMRSMPADRFVGIDISRDRDNKTIYLSQTEYINKILEKLNMLECNPTNTPADPSVKLSSSMSPQNEEESSQMKNVPYKELVGCLTHLSHTTRPDIAQALGQVARYSQNPGREHWKSSKRILAYLKGTANVGIGFGREKNCLIGYCDSDYAGDR